MIDGFLRLRHHAVVGGNHEHGDVRDLRTACAHRREGFVARRIKKGDLAPVALRLISADVLGDAAGLARGYLRVADGVQQRRLAVVHVTEHSHDWRA